MTCIYRDDRIVTTAGVAIDESGRYFLARRQPGGAQSERWEFPGGKCDEGDVDERSCLAREFLEELGVTIEVHEEIGSVPFEHKSIPYLLVGYRVRFLAVYEKLMVHSEAGWYTDTQMRALDLADSDRRLVDQYFPYP